MKPLGIYLGDGAYAVYKDQLEISAERPCESSGIPGNIERHWVALEPSALQRLVDFARAELGWKVE